MAENAQVIPPELLEKKKKLITSFPFYARNCLKIKTKKGEVIPFQMNTAQKYVHERLEEQKREKGYVRAIILKGRQQGISTYIQGRYKHKTTNTFGINAFILTHEDKATQTLFDMGKRYYDNLPIFMKPKVKKSNEKALNFGALDSGYAVGTAGNRSVGRSMNNHLLHGSEVAFWPNAAEHAKGIMQTVGLEPGTEIILESTANGMGNYYHQQWKLAEKGLSDFIAIFVPWFWEPGYRRPITDDFQPTDDELELKEYYGLDDQQLCWRRAKIVELSADGIDGTKAFKQEYPCNPVEAFQVTGGDGLISDDHVLAARKNKVNPGTAFYVGVDPSRGGDRFALIRRSHRKAWGYETYTGTEINTLGQQVAVCKRILDTVDPHTNKVPDMMFIDAGGGSSLVDRLHELGYEKRVKAIPFGGAALNPDKYSNKRNEMWGEMNLWFRNEDLPVEIPDSDELHADLLASPFKRDSNDRICLLAKEDIIKKFGFSPDGGDALALTFTGHKIEDNWQPPKVVKRNRSATRFDRR